MKRTILFASFLLAIALQAVIEVKSITNDQYDYIYSNATRRVTGWSYDSSMSTAINFVKLWDISNPNAPVAGETLHESNYPWGYASIVKPLIFQNLLIYSDSERMFIYDISDVQNAVLINNMPCNAVYSFAILEHYLLLGTETGYIKIYDLLTPQVSTPVGECFVSPYIWRMWVYHNQLVISCGMLYSPTLKILQFDPQTMSFSIESSIEQPTRETYVHELNDKLMVFLENQDIRIYDTSISGSPLLLNEIALGTGEHSIITDGQRVYYNDEANKILVLELNDSYQFIIRARFQIPGYSYNIYQLREAQNGRLICNHYWGSVYTLDVSNLEPEPALLSHYEDGSYFSDLSYQQGYEGQEDAVFCAHAGAVSRFNLVDGNTLTPVSTLNTLGSISDTEIKDYHLYALSTIGNANYLLTVNCANPDQYSLENISPSGSAAKLDLQENALYLLPTTGSVSKYDLDYQNIPTWQRDLDPDALESDDSWFNPLSVVQAGNSHYVVGSMQSEYGSGRNTLAYWRQTIEPEFMFLDTPARAIYNFGEYLILPGNGLSTFRISDQLPPEPVSSSYQDRMFSNATGSAVYQQQYLIVAFSASNSICIFDVSNPLQPVMIQRFSSPYPAVKLAVGQDKLFVSNGVNGIDVYDLSSQTANADHVSDLPENQIKAYPNPFSHQVKLSFYIDKAQPVNLQIYNVKGQLVRALPPQNGKKGENTLSWDGLNDQGKPCSGGIYIARLHTYEGTLAGKLIKLK
jgi:hypothetical protein